MFNNFFFPKNLTDNEIMWKNIVEPERWYGTWTLHVRCLRLQTYSQNVKFFLLFHNNNGYANAPQCNVYPYIASFANFDTRCRWVLVLSPSRLTLGERTLDTHLVVRWARLSWMFVAHTLSNMCPEPAISVLMWFWPCIFVNIWK